MDKELATKICKTAASSKDELREALAWSLGIEIKTKVKGDKSLFNACKSIFYEAYEKQNQFGYIFRTRDGVALASVLKKIESIVTDPTDEMLVENTFKALIEQLPEWYRKNAFSLPVIDSKFNQIANCIKQNGQSKQPVSNDYKARIVGDLLA